MPWRPVCSTGVVTVAKQRLRVAWTTAGVAYVDDASPSAKRLMAKRLRMQLIDRPVPAAIQAAVKKSEKRPGSDDVPVDLSWARDYERDVLLAARSIPWGETRPYSWLAREARRPRAVRAAATVIARNPLWFLVPWHRVVHKDGRAGSTESAFGKLKRQLLAREAATPAAQPPKPRG